MGRDEAGVAIQGVDISLSPPESAAGCTVSAFRCDRYVGEGRGKPSIGRKVGKLEEEKAGKPSSSGVPGGVLLRLEPPITVRSKYPRW